MDQCFPALLPAGDHQAGDCVAILCIEHANIADFSDLFLSLVEKYAIARGRVILLSSVSLPSSYRPGGLRHGHGDSRRSVTVWTGTWRPSPSRWEGARTPSLYGQYLTPAFACKLLWVTHSIISPMRLSPTKWEAVGGGVQQPYGAHFRLSNDMHAIVKNVFASSGHPGLCKTVIPVTQTWENPLVSSLL